MTDLNSTTGTTLAAWIAEQRAAGERAAALAAQEAKEYRDEENKHATERVNRILHGWGVPGSVEAQTNDYETVTFALGGITFRLRDGRFLAPDATVVLNGVDLAKWLDGTYKLPDPPAAPEPEQPEPTYPDLYRSGVIEDRRDLDYFLNKQASGGYDFHAMSAESTEGVGRLWVVVKRTGAGK